MSSPISPGSNSNLLDDQPSSPTTNNNPESSTTLSSNPNSPPRPQIPPGHLGPIRSPHPHDVLSGRGGRINSHPGNVHFREMVDSYKRDYLDPRTKKVEKARIAAKIVATVRSLEPNGRFLKEDPHTGCWVEIGDERAWKKAGQALRESAPEIRAEREKMLRGLAGADADKLPVSTSKSTPSKKVQQQSQQRQADPPGPRHRPNPPAREGLGRSNSSRSYTDNNEPELAVRSSKKQTSEGDAELERMRQEYYQMQRMQAEQQRRMEQYQAQLAAAGALDGTSTTNNTATTTTTTSAEYDRDVYNEYTKMQAGIMRNSGYCQQVGGGNHHHPMGGVPQGGNNKQRFSNQDIAAAVLDSGLLPANSGFDMPVARGEQQIGSAAQLGLPGGGQQYHQQQFANHPQQYGGGDNVAQNYQGVHHQDQEVDAFANQHFNSCDKTVSTMSSFDVQSMDMSSLGGFSWNQSGYNMSGLISTGSRNDGNGGGGFNASQRSSPKKSSKSGKSSLERKLEKVNEQHRRQQMQEMQRKQQQSQMMMMQGGSGGVHGGPIDVPTAGGASWHQQQQVPTSNPTTNRSRKYSQEHNNMASLNSFGFEAIEEDDITEASYKMSNLGLSGMSGMDMTFASDILSIRSKSVPKMRVGDDTNKKEKDGKNRRTSSNNEEHLKRRSSDGDEGANGGTNNKPAAEVGVSSVLFNQSLSSTSNTSGGSSSMSMKAKGPPNMEDFNESFKSMEMEDSRSKGSGGSGGGRGGKPPQARQRQRLPDPDGVVGGGHRLANSSAGRRKDPSGGRLGTIHSSRGRSKQHGAVSSSHAASAAAASTNNAARLPYSSSSNTNNNRRGSNSSLGISDPDMMLQSGLGLSSNNNMDFGVSLDSLKSFNQSVQSGESWLNQYNSVENIGTDRNPWDDEDAERHGTGSSDGTSMSEISAPRMVTTGGGD